MATTRLRQPSSRIKDHRYQRSAIPQLHEIPSTTSSNPQIRTPLSETQNPNRQRAILPRQALGAARRNKIFPKHYPGTTGSSTPSSARLNLLRGRRQIQKSLSLSLSLTHKGCGGFYSLPPHTLS